MFIMNVMTRIEFNYAEIYFDGVGLVDGDRVDALVSSEIYYYN